VAFLPEGIDTINAEVLDRARRLKIIADRAVGTDNVDINAATRNGIVVTNTPGILQDACADMTFALLLSFARQVTRSDRAIRAGKWTVFDQTPYLGLDAYNKTLGIFGFGGIGQKVARRAAGFDMRVIYYSRTRRPEAERELGAEWAGDLETLLRESDYLSLHCPLTDETRGLMGEAEFALMKPSAVLVNMARGPVVQQTALYEALAGNVIAGAAIDVCDPEPMPVDDPLLTLDNLVITPHIGSASAATFTAMGMMAARSIVAALSGEPVKNMVNPEALANR
jgi:glyoxylate reductase